MSDRLPRAAHDPHRQQPEDDAEAQQAGRDDVLRGVAPRPGAGEEGTGDRAERREDGHVVDVITLAVARGRMARVAEGLPPVGMGGNP